MSRKYYNKDRDGKCGVRMLKDKEANKIPRHPGQKRAVKHIHVPASDDEQRLSLSLLPARRINRALREMELRRIGKEIVYAGKTRTFKDATDRELVLIVQGKL